MINYIEFDWSSWVQKLRANLYLSDLYALNAFDSKIVICICFCKWKDQYHNGCFYLNVLRCSLYQVYLGKWA